MAPQLRWELDDAPDAQTALFGEPERHIGKGEFRGMEFLHVNARSIINEIPPASMLPFRWTINAYRGCSHACSYCQTGDTPILMADGRLKLLADVRAGDWVYGTEGRGAYRRYVPTEVLDHWMSVRHAYRVLLEDGTELIASGDPRCLTNRGWKRVVGKAAGAGCGPHLTTNDSLFGTGAFAK